MNVLYLLAQEVFALLLVKVASCLVLNLSLELHELDDVVGKLDSLLQTLKFGRAGEKLVLLLNGKRQITANRVEHEGARLHVADILGELVRIVVQDRH